MSVFHENMLIGASGQAPAATGISRSLRFNSNDSANLSRGFSSGSQTTWTYSAWLKRTSLATSGLNSNIFLLCIPEAATQTRLQLSNDSTIKFLWSQGAASVSTSAVFRDVSAWYHILFVWDTNNGTAADRAKLFINGSQVTLSGTSISSGFTTDINSAKTHNICRLYDGANNYYSDGYLADIYFIDGQALTPSSFTETDATTGQLIPKAYTGSYGTNGFHLEFADNSSNTATTLGKDTSGNSPANNWTPNNLSVTAGAGNDSLVDVPTNGAQTDTGVGGEVRGNYCTLNPLDSNSSLTLQNGNLYASNGAASHRTSRGTIAITSGKWYWEVTLDSALTGSTALTAGIATSSLSLSSIPGTDANSYGWYNDGGGGSLKYNNNSSANYGSVISNGVVVGVAFDANAGTLTFYRNGSSQGTAYSSIPAGTYFPTVALYNVNATVNFGQRPFAYTAPSGFKALCTANLPAPLVTKANTVFDTLLYTGNGSARSITGLGFNPDLVWIKERNAAADHALYDAVRGVEKRLESNTQDIEVTSDGGVTAFNSDGFSLGTLAQVNTNNDTYVAWAWDAGSSTVTNNSGSITGAQVRANATAGVSVVAVTKTGTGTVGHGLGVKPELIILKSRADVDAWYVHHSALAANQSLFLNTTGATATSNGYWNNTLPTSTVFSVGSAIPNSNLIAYCFAPVVGYANAFSYTGNGSSDGPMVYLGFRPRLILLKASSAAYGWSLIDTARDPYNVATKSLVPNESVEEQNLSSGALDVLSNGFKLRFNYLGTNSSGVTYIGYAWAESPFNYARAR